MSMKESYAVKRLLDATGQLHAARLYERLSDSDCFLIRMPKLGEQALAVLMGYGGQTYGLKSVSGSKRGRVLPRAVRVGRRTSSTSIVE
ncbi:hypothetical protein OT109_12360 [Phycisphaeraceae bacterium D3-23]